MKTNFRNMTDINCNIKEWAVETATGFKGDKSCGSFKIECMKS